VIGVELTPEHPVDRAAALGERAETEGFDAVFASCHYNNRDPFVALDRIARRTDGIALGPGVANPYETHPVTLASRVATLEEASGGRAVYGLGAGDPSTLSNLGYDHEKPLRRVLEAFKTAERLFDGERVDRDGTFRARDAGLNFADEVGSVPVYVGAQGPHMVRMSAKHADGVLFNGSHPRDYEWAASQIEEGLAERPDDRGEFDFAAYAAVSVAEDDDAARAAARPPVAFIAGGAAPPLLDRHGLDAALAELRERDLVSLRAGTYHRESPKSPGRLTRVRNWLVGTARRLARPVAAEFRSDNPYGEAKRTGVDTARSHRGSRDGSTEASSNDGTGSIAEKKHLKQRERE